jgi:hypothetical protein
VTWCNATVLIQDTNLISGFYKAIISYTNPKQVWWQWFIGDVWYARGTWA